MGQQPTKSPVFLRWEDFWPGTQSATPDRDVQVDIRECDQIVSVETLFDAFGYAHTRVWIVGTDPY